MNIEGVNLLSLLPGNTTIEGGARPLLENGAIPEGFADALMGQIELLSEANGQVELPGQSQNMTMPQPIDNLLKHKSDEKELAALFDKYLPLSYKKNEVVDLEATLPALTHTLKSITPSITADEAATAQNPSLALTDALKSITPSITADEAATAQNPSPALTHALKPITPSITADEVAAAQNPSPALTDALKSITPSITADEVAAAQNMSNVVALNGLSFVKPLPEEAKLNRLGKEDVVSGDFLQKETVLLKSIQDKQGLNLQALENAAPAEKTLVLEKQTSISGIEKAVPGVTADMIPFHRPVDNITESPAITRPLTHAGWSKDLGEQIIWMNNKAIAAAEIKLNPEHLGPISVRIDVNKDQATILFTAQHGDVKEAIEASIPKLREMLATQQLNLVNVNISQNSTSDQGRSQSQTFSKTPENSEQGIDGVTGTLEKTEHDRAIVSKGLLSLYA